MGKERRATACRAAPAGLVTWAEGCRRLGISLQTGERRLRKGDKRLPTPMKIGRHRYFMESDLAKRARPRWAMPARTLHPAAVHQAAA